MRCLTEPQFALDGFVGEISHSHGGEFEDDLFCEMPRRVIW
jgi:hypothetical protein